MKFTYDFDGIEKTMTAARRGIKDGMEDSADTLLDEAQDSAQDTIIRERRIWRGELYSSWKQDVDDLSPTRVDGSLKNYSVHAATIDEGRTPGETAPQVQHIIEWVDDKVNTDTNPADYGGGGGSISVTSRTGLTKNSGSTVMVGSRNPSEISQEFGLDSNFAYEDPTPQGFKRNDPYLSQSVVLYDEDKDEYYEGEVDRVKGPTRFSVTYDDGGAVDNRAAVRTGSNIDDRYKIAAYVPFSRLSEKEQDNVLDEQIDRTGVDAEFDSDTKTEIRDVLRQWVKIDPENALSLTHHVEAYRYQDPSTGNPHVPSVGSTTGQYSIYLHNNPNDIPPKFRNDNDGKISTMRHEHAHVYTKTLDTTYVPVARQTFNIKNDFVNDASRTLPWDFVERDESTWGSTNYDVGHPAMYMNLTAEERDKSEYPAFEDGFKDGIYDNVTDFIKDTSGVPWDKFYDKRNKLVLTPDGPNTIEEGNIIKLDVDGDTGNFKIISTPVVEKNDSGDRRFRFKAKHLQTGGTKNMGVSADTGEFGSNKVNYLQWAVSEGKVETNGELHDNKNSPTQFYADKDDPDELFREAINRAEWRVMLMSEIAPPEPKRNSFIDRPYAHIDSEEVIAHFMAFFLERGDSEITDLEDDAKNLYKYHPDLLWAAKEKFGFPSHFADMLTKGTGKTTTQIINELDDKYA